MKMLDGIAAALLHITRPQMVHKLISVGERYDHKAGQQKETDSEY